MIKARANHIDFTNQYILIKSRDKNGVIKINSSKSNKLLPSISRNQKTFEDGLEMVEE